MSLCSFTSALDVRPPWSLGWGRCGVCNCCSQPQQKCPEGCGPSLPRWDRAAPSVVATEVSMQAQLTGCFVLGEPCPEQERAGAGDAVTPELLFLVSLLPFIQPQPSAQGRMEGEQLLLHGWARTRVMRLMDAFSSLAVGAALAWCSLGIVEHTQPWLPCKHLPVTPKLGWAPRPPRGAMGSGSAS